MPFPGNSACHLRLSLAMSFLSFTGSRTLCRASSKHIGIDTFNIDDLYRSQASQLASRLHPGSRFPSMLQRTKQFSSDMHTATRTHTTLSCNGLNNLIMELSSGAVMTPNCTLLHHPRTNSCLSDEVLSSCEFLASYTFSTPYFISSVSSVPEQVSISVYNPQTCLDPTLSPTKLRIFSEDQQLPKQHFLIFQLLRLIQQIQSD